MTGAEVARSVPAPPGGAAVAQAGEIRSSRIESLRAIAALGVLLGHAWLLAGPTRGYASQVLLGGGFGVYLFFALTGYLLFWPFAKRDYGGGGAIDLWTYARNRAFRILPLYYVVLVAVLLLQFHGGTAGQWWRFALFAENFSHNTVETVDGPMWSLVVELHFYVLLPLIAFGLARLSRGRRGRAALLIAGLGIASYAAREALVLHSDISQNALWRDSLPTLFCYFTVGMLLALLRLEWSERPPRALRGAAASSDLWLGVALALWLVLCDRYGSEWLAAAASFLAVGACVLPLRRGAVVRALEWRPLAVLGLASYSLYLWHLPLLTQLSHHTRSFAALLILGGAASVLVALASFAWVETPFLRLRRRWAPAAAAQAR